MISISYHAIPKNTTVKTSGGLYGLGSTGGSTNNTQSSAVNTDNIKAVTVTTNYLTVGSVGNIQNIDSNKINTNYISSSEGKISKMTSVDTVSTHLYADNIECISTDANVITSDKITVNDLTVTGQAHFFELVIDKIKAAGGHVIFSAGNGFTVSKVEQDYDDYVLFWHASDGENAITNTIQQHDLIICKNFNQAYTGTSQNVRNKYYWCEVIYSSSAPVDVDGKSMHYVVISNNAAHDPDCYIFPEVGDEVAMLGNTYDPNRQSAIYLAAGTSSMDLGLQTPLMAQYQGINGTYWDLSHYRKSFFDRTSAKFIGDFSVETNGGTQDILDYIDDEISNINITGIKGDDGISTYTMVFDNQMVNLSCDYNGAPLDSSDIVVRASLYYGNDIISPSAIANYSVSYVSGAYWDTSCYIGTDDAGLKMVVPSNLFAYDNSSYLDANVFKVSAYLSNAYNNKVVTNNFYINRVRAGENGVTTPLYELMSDVKHIAVNKNGAVVNLPANKAITIWVNRHYKNETKRMNYLPDGYVLTDANGNTLNYSNGHTFTVSSTTDKYIFYLRKEDDTLVDLIEFPILRDGADGTSANAYSLGLNTFNVVVEPDGDTIMTVSCAPYLNENNSKSPIGNCTLRWTTNGSVSGSYFIDYPSSSSELVQVYITRNLGNYKTSETTIGNAVCLELINGTASSSSTVLASEVTPIVFQPSASLKVSSDLNTITQTVQGHTSTIENNYNTLNNLITTVETSLSGVRSDVTGLKTTTNALTGEITDIKKNYSTITQTDELIEQKVGSIGLGGQNILDRTEMTSVDYMSTSSITGSTPFQFQANSVSGASLSSPSTPYHTTSIAIDLTTSSSTNSSGANYYDIKQSLVGKLMKNTNYTLHFKYKATYKAHTFNTSKCAARVYITHTNSTMINVNGTPVSSPPADLNTLLPATTDWTPMTIKFTTGSTAGDTGNCMLYIRTFIGSSLQLCDLKLEEGHFPSAWSESNNDTMSVIRQTSESIALTVKNDITDDLAYTGINITSGDIVLNADRTTINGNLNIRNSYEGLVVYDTEGNQKVKIQNTEIPNVGDLYKPSLTQYQVSLADKIIGSEYFTFYSKYQEIGKFVKGDTILIEYANLHFKQYETSDKQVDIKLSATSYITVTQEIYNVKTGVAVTSTAQKITSTNENTQLWGHTLNPLSYVAPNDGTYKIRVIVKYYAPLISIRQFSFLWIPVVRHTVHGYTQIGTNGLVSIQDENNYLYYGKDGFNVYAESGGFYNGLRVSKYDLETLKSIEEYNNTRYELWFNPSSFAKVALNPIGEMKSVIITTSNKPTHAVIRADKYGEYYNYDTFIITGFLKMKDGTTHKSNYGIVLPKSTVTLVDNTKYAVIDAGRKITIINMTENTCYLFTDDVSCKVQGKDSSSASNNFALTKYKSATLVYSGVHWYEI